ncbi:MAG TPA: prenyltransferase/squalene oxidase repeat-containing protein, partial [Planctomycetota bacterium]|nr:prenyltransferase/squalene oxidase repeat-containing protein [Planctomycetota bacterium]
MDVRERPDAPILGGSGASARSEAPRRAKEPGGAGGSLEDRAAGALERAVENLLRRQAPEGCWCAELEGDSILESEYILTKWIIGEEADPRLPGIASYLRRLQREDGAWGQYPGGEVGGGKLDLSATVKGYFALKLMGDDPHAPHMARARDLILAHGGAAMANTFSKFYLAALGQIRYDAVPIIPPQIIYLPRWSYFHMTKVSAWTRTMIAPLSIVSMHRPVRRLPPGLGIDELYPDERTRHSLTRTGHSRSPFWTNLFLLADWNLKLLDRFRLLPLREQALERMTDWLLQRSRGSDGPGAIFPPLVYLLIALVACRRFPPNHPVVRDTVRHLDNYMIHGLDGTPRNRAEDASDETIRLQPCESVVWDTGIAAYALANAGLDARHPAMRRCADWLVSKECREPADWVANVKGPVEPSGWYFEYRNPWYPDVDDTVMVAMALRRIGTPDGIAASERSARWVLAMQNEDGGWSAFDRTRDRPLLEYVPFADHNAMQDPSCADITGRALESLGQLGFGAGHPAVQGALEYRKRTATPGEGCWYGRWGVNYIYGTYQVLVG